MTGHTDQGAGAGMTESILDIAGRNIDRLVTVEMRLSDYSRGVIVKLYEAALAEAGGGSLSMRAARHVIANVAPGRPVLLTTGAGDPKFLPAGETDGPPGVAILARAVAMLGGLPVLLTESAFQDNLAKTVLAAGLGIRDPDLLAEVGWTAAVLPLGADDTAEAEAARLLDRFKPTLLVAVEKLGPNRDGIGHTASGKPTSTTRARAEHLFDLAASRGIPSVGIGDNGNEIGFGRIIEAVHAHKPAGERLATRVATDVLVAANTSNWGAYAVAAAMAVILERPEFLHGPEDEERMLVANVLANGVDGSTGRHILQVDGMPLDVQRGLVAMLNGIVRNALVKGFKRAF